MTSATLVRAGALDDAEAVVEHRLMEGAVLRAQIISTLGRFMAREGPLLAPIPPSNVDAPPLYEVAGEADPGGLAVERGTGEFVVEEAQQAIKRGLVAAVRRRGQ